MVKVSDRELMDEYRNSDPEARVIMMLDNYKGYGKMLVKLEKKITYRIKTEKERMRSKMLEMQTERVQTSGTSNPTESESIFNVMLSGAFETGEIQSGILSGIEDSVQFETDIRIISVMKKEFVLLEDMIELLDEDDCRFFHEYTCRNTSIKEMLTPDSKTQSYTAAKRRMTRIKDDLISDMLDCIEENVI